jgi:hypothetical protein
MHPTTTDLRGAPLPTLLRWSRVAADVRSNLSAVSRTEQVEWNLVRVAETIDALDREAARRTALAEGARSHARAG